MQTTRDTDDPGPTAPFVELTTSVGDRRSGSGARAGAGAGGAGAGGSGLPPTRRGLIAGLIVAASLVVLVVLAVGIVIARQIAETEAAGEAARTAELLGDVIVEPALSDGLLDGDPAARAALDELVRSRVLGTSVVRVKIWDAAGTIVYSDEPRLIGETFGLDEEEREILEGGGVDAEVSDLSAPENRFETGQGDLLEAYHAVRTPSGRSVLFEAYFRYDQVSERSGALWAAFSLLASGSVLALILLLLPIGRRLLVYLRDVRAQREALLQHALEASSNERRRIAARLHDGAIQDLTASALALSAGASSARRTGDGALAQQLDTAATAVRGSVGGLRSLLVDVYPPSLAAAGLDVALDDLATAVRARGLQVEVVNRLAPDALGPDQARLLFRVARECLANTVRHAAARSVTVTIGAASAGAPAGPDAPTGPDAPSGPGAPATGVALDIVDDGRGFDPAALARPASGHLGIPLLVEAAESAGARLAVSSAPGAGTHWRLELAPELTSAPRRHRGGGDSGGRG